MSIGQCSHSQSAWRCWENYIKWWYPNLHHQIYFLPPLHFNCVPYDIQLVAGQCVFVKRVPQKTEHPHHHSASHHGRAASTTADPPPFKTSMLFSTRTKARHSKDKYSIWKYEHIAKLPVSSAAVLDSVVRDDCAQQQVWCCLQVLATKLKDAMMVLSKLQFNKYQHKSCYWSAKAELSEIPTSKCLDLKYFEGDFDVLIIHRKHGLIIGEVKSVGSNFDKLKMTDAEKETALKKRLELAVEQLNKGETVLKQLLSDIKEIKITKICIFPYIPSETLKQVLDADPQLKEVRIFIT